MEEGSEEEKLQQTANKKSKKTIIKIPSYQEVIESSQPKSQSFSQAFAFLKSSEFYSPPPKPFSASSSQSSPASEITNPRCLFPHFPFKLTVSLSFTPPVIYFLFVYFFFKIFFYDFVFWVSWISICNVWSVVDFRKNDQLDTSSSSTSASTATPINSLSVPSSVSRNAILVSNRQVRLLI